LTVNYRVLGFTVNCHEIWCYGSLLRNMSVNYHDIDISVIFTVKWNMAKLLCNNSKILRHQRPTRSTECHSSYSY